MTGYARNLGALTEPEQQGYDPVKEPTDPTQTFDPLGDGTVLYACPECGALWNADDLHTADCSRRGLRAT